jgi:hypothetical protein
MYKPDEVAPTREQQRRVQPAEERLSPVDGAVGQEVVEEAERDHVDDEAGGGPDQGQHRGHVGEDDLQRRGQRHGHDQQEAQREDHAEGEHPLAQPRREGVRASRLAVEDQS